MSKEIVRVSAAILKKDVLSLYPLLFLTAALQVSDVLVTRLEILPVLNLFLPPALIVANSILILALIQADPPVSLVSDWLCRPVPRRALLLAKGLQLMFALYVARALAILLIDLHQGYPLGESLLDALLIQNTNILLYVPIVLMVALCTANLVQAIGLLVGMFILVFVIPTPLITAPGPEDLAVGEALNTNGLWWISMVPTKLLFIGASALCLWAAYGSRNLLLARWSLGGGMVLGLLACVAPILLLPWEATFTVHRFLYGAQPAADSPSYKAILRPANACFPSVRIGNLAADGDFSSARQRLGVQWWDEDQLKAAGNGSIAFVTNVGLRGVPADWRVQVAYAKASYYDSDSVPLVTLRPSLHGASSVNGMSGETITHTWLFPEAALRKIANANGSRLEIDYSVALLEPVSGALAIDGSRRHIPGIGHCSASRDVLENSVLVDCFSVGRRPALISAELDGVPASRVDAGTVDYLPEPLGWLNGRRAKIAVQAPDLVDSDIVKVTGYYPEVFNHLLVRSEGLWGNSNSLCPAAAADFYSTQDVASWNDRSPHERKSVAVEEGVQLEVLDWGGSGTTVVLVPGLGATAHSFDEMAPLLAPHYRVVGFTRRGIGASSRPDHGYGQATLTQDIVKVLNALGIDKAVLVGHSIAGEELSALGVNYPQRVAALIYLDAAYDRVASASSERDRELNAALPDGPAPLPDELLSYSAMHRYFDRLGVPPLPEGELIAARNMGNRYLAGQVAMDARVAQAIQAGVQSPDYANLHVPALAIYATFGGPDALLEPWYDASDTGLRTVLRELQANTEATQRREIERFRNGVKGSEVLEIPGADHWIILSNRDDVVRAIKDFVARLPRA